MRSPRRSAPRIHELLVRLSDVEPPVWRRIRVSSGATLWRAAGVFAVALGWPPGRPFAFLAGGMRYEGRGARSEGRDEAEEVRLRQVLHDAGAELEFDYGNGHPWHMEVRLERMLPRDGEIRTPYCVDGAGNAPPIDVGGPWGYEEWRGSPSGEHGRGGGWDYELGAARREGRTVEPRFNVDVVNAELERLR